MTGSSFAFRKASQLHLSEGTRPARNTQGRALFAQQHKLKRKHILTSAALWVWVRKNKFQYTKINGELSLTSAAWERHPQEYSIFQQFLYTLALWWSHHITSHTGILGAGWLLQGANTRHALSWEGMGMHLFSFFFFSGYFWNWYFSFCLSPSFPAFSMMCFFFPFFAFFLPFLIFPNPALKSLTLKTKQNKTRKRAIHKPSANTLTDAAYKPSCEVKQTCNVSHQKLSLSLSVWVPTL